MSQQLGVGEQNSMLPTMTEPIQRYSQPDEQGSNSDPYAIQENRQAQYTNPYDIPSDYNPNDYVYNSTQQAPTNDPHGKTWTDEQEKRKRLQDATKERDNLMNSFVGMPTTKVVLKLGEYDDEIKKLSSELGVGESVANTPLGQGFVDDVVDREQEIADQSTKPSVPTMTEPADDEQSEFELYGSAKPEPTLTELLQQDALDKPFGQLGALTPDWEKPQDGSGNAGGGYVNLYDDIPTMEDIEAAYQAAKPAPYTSGVEGGDIGIDVINDYGENNEIGFDDMAEVLTNIYENPDETEKILYANGFDSLGELKGKMQEDGHLFDYLDLTGKLEGMGYEQQKVGEGAAFAMKPRYGYEGNEAAWEMEKIGDTLTSLIQLVSEDAQLKRYFEESVEAIQKGEEFDTNDFIQTSVQGKSFGNTIYRRDEKVFDSYIQSQMEVLNAATVSVYSEQGETLDDIVRDTVPIFISSGTKEDTSELDLFTNAIDEMVESIKAEADPGKILQDGDVRISTQNFEQEGFGKYTHYFFRGSEFLYSINTFGGIIVYGVNYDKTLKEMLQESIY